MSDECMRIIYEDELDVAAKDDRIAALEAERDQLVAALQELHEKIDILHKEALAKLEKENE